MPYDQAALAELELFARVTVAGEEKLAIYTDNPVSSPQLFAADRVTLWRTPAQVAPPQPDPQYPLDVVLGDRVRLLGYDLATTAVRPGESLTLTLYWEALVPFDQNYQVFTHLFDGEIIGQHDGAPECGVMPTTRWEPGQIIVDPHPIAVNADAPAGSAQLLIGMYNLVTLQRLTESTTGRDAIYLTDVIVGE
jgi:hypothetical protein